MNQYTYKNNKNEIYFNVIPTKNKCLQQHIFV